VDPFPSLGDGTQVPSLLGESANARGYRVLGLLSNTGRGAVFIGVDVTRRRRCVFKAAARRAGDQPSDMEMALRREATLLRSLPANPAWPAVYDLLETTDQLLLVIEDIAGLSLGEYIADRTMQGSPMQTSEVAELALKVVKAVGALHQQGVVHRDLKSSNVLLTPEGGVRLIDFEHAAVAGTQGRSGGTRGYMSPQQLAGHPAGYSDDVYAVGALLMLLTTGCEPSQAPDGANLLTRPLERLRPEISPVVARLTRACLSPSLDDRTPGMRAISAALHDVRGWPTSVQRPRPPTHDSGDEREALLLKGPDLVETAQRLCDSLCDRAVLAPNRTLTWMSTAPGTLPVPYRQINNGVPGILLGLASGWAAGGVERHRDALTRGARWLAESQELPGARISGLYAGEAGVGAALLLGGLLAGDRAMVDSAYEVELRLRQYPFESIDLYHGTAGRLRFLAMLWLLDRDRDVLAHALRCADHIHAKATKTHEGQSWWKGEEDAGGLALASYAHGTAGIADALLDLYEITGEGQHLDLVQSSTRWVTERAVTSLSDGAGVDWGNGGAFGGLWCYGASGVGLLYLHLLRLKVDAEAGDIATRAGRTAALAGRYAGPGLCHGLGGSIEYLLDLHQHTADHMSLSQAWELQRLMDAYRRQHSSGLSYPSTKENESDSSYMLGDAGLVGTLLRQAADGRFPRLLSIDAVRRLIAHSALDDPGVLGPAVAQQASVPCIE
jgi:serine/threonine protein kinase